MPILKDYRQFGGYYLETASIQNALAYQGVTIPQTGKPFSEPMLLGLSGGITVGYFSFAYEGYDPHVALLTRNTFDPMERIFERIGIVQNVHQTTKPDKAVRNLIEVLEDGRPALVWADMFSLPYNAWPNDDKMWVMMPIVVYGYDDVANRVLISDRSLVPLEITAEELAAAWGRVANNKYKLMTLEVPDLDRLPKAIEKGIRTCISLYTEMPPKGSKNNFGFAALKRWADLLVKSRDRISWAKTFPRGPKLYAGLTTTFHCIETFGTGGCAARGQYAEFLDEAALILKKNTLKEVANQFRVSGEAWRVFANALLPDNVPLLAEARTLTLRRHDLFANQGGAALGEIHAINKRLEAIKAEVKKEFPLDEKETAALLEGLRAHILKLHDLELAAVTALEEAIA